MKGTIVKCLEELVITQFGKDKWEKSLSDVGLNTSTVFWPRADIDDGQVLKLVGAVCGNLDISPSQAADAFGDYWVNVYSQRMYPLYYERNATARDLLLDMNAVHTEMTRSLQNARPPRFEYEWEDDKTLVMCYKSHRGLLDFVVGLVKGVGKRYEEPLQVTRIDPDKVQTVFA